MVRNPEESEVLNQAEADDSLLPVMSVVLWPAQHKLHPIEACQEVHQGCFYDKNICKKRSKQLSIKFSNC